MEIKKIKCNNYNPGLRIRELTAGGVLSNADWKKISKKVMKLN